MRTKLLYTLCLLFSSFSVYAQKRNRILREIELPVFEIAEPKVTDLFESIVLKQEIDTLLNKSFLYVSYIKKDPDNDMYLIHIYHIPSFAIRDNSDFRGVFYIRDTPFIMTKGCNPKYYFGDNQDSTHFLFRDTFTKITIKYYNLEPPTITYVDPERWTFFYAYKGISFIEMPEILLDRIGFVPCE